MAQRDDITRLRSELSEAQWQELQERLRRALAPEPAPPLIPRRPAGQAPLSFAQQRLWFLDQLDPDSLAYHRPAHILLRGPLDVSILERCLDEILERHEVLRTTFPSADGHTVQDIASQACLPLGVIDLGDFPESERWFEARRLADDEFQQPFDLARGPLVRARLVRLGERQHVLLLMLHHVIFDGWSEGLLHGELATLYQAFAAGRPSPLPPLPLQYADFAVWQRQQLHEERIQGQIDYWRRQLAGAPTTLELPAERARPGSRRNKGARHCLSLGRELSDRLKELGGREGATPFMTLLAAFQVLLGRYSGQEDLVVGCPVAGRPRAELEELIGCFVNTVVLRADLSGCPTFRELLRRVRATCLEAYAHQDLPFERLVQELQPDRDSARSPYFRVMFQLASFPHGAVQQGELQFTSFETATVGTAVDIALKVSDGPDGLLCEARYDVDLFARETMERFLEDYRTLLAGIVADPEQPIAELPLLTEAERRQVLVEWNQTQTDYPGEACIPQLFEAQAQRTPDAIALVFEEQQLTYGALNARANRLAHHLRRLGVGTETLVGLCLERSPEMVVALLAILKAGGAYVPLDPGYPRARLAFLVEDAQVAVLLTRQPFLSVLPRHQARIVCLDACAGTLDRENSANLPSVVTPDNLAYVMYTSGSTGKPKGVMVCHRGIVRLLFGVDYVRLDPSTTLLHHSPASFDASTLELWGPLLHGGRCVLFDGRVPTVQALEQAIARHGVNTLWLTAALFNLVVDEAT